MALYPVLPFRVESDNGSGNLEFWHKIRSYTAKKNNDAPKAKITLLKTIEQDYAPENLYGAPKKQNYASNNQDYALDNRKYAPDNRKYAPENLNYAPKTKITLL